MKLLNITPINSGDLVHKVFNKPGFIEKTAHRIRLVGYGFLFIAVLAMVIQFIFPFINNPPDLFMQLLFLLALWGIFEIFSIPLEHFHDYYVVDFEKNWIALSQKRFFYYNVKVLASFNQIKAIGASEQPLSLAKLLNFSKVKKYAIFVQTLKNELIQISDYCLTIEEANDFCHRLYSTHFSGAAFIGGMPGMQIKIDQNSGIAASVPQEMNSAKIFVSLIRDISQMVLAIVIGTIIFAVSIFLIEWATLKFFNTNINTLKQPFIQLFYHKFQTIKQDKEPQQEKKSTEKNKLIVTVPVIPQIATQTVNINFNDKKIIIFDASKTKQVDTSASVQKPAGKAQDSARNLTGKVAKTEIETKTDTATSTTQETKKVQTNKKKQSNVSPQASTSAEDSQENKLQKNTNKTNKKPVSDFKVAKKHSDYDKKFHPSESKQKARAYSFKPPEYHQIKSSIPSIDTEIIAKAPIKSSQTRAEKLTIIPGRGIAPELFLNTSFKKLKHKLGEPLSEIKGKDYTQFIYSSFSIKTLNNLQKSIVKIVITSSKYKSKMKISTSENIRIGDSINAVENHFGPYSLIKSLPGLHYPEKGISFIAKPDSPDTIRAISIYQSENL